MANGAIFNEINEILKTNPNSLTIEARDRLVLKGIIGLHERIDNLPKIGLEEIKKLERHDRILFGDGETKESGLVKDVEDIKFFIKDMKDGLRKAVWSILAPILTVIGLGIVTLIVLGFTLGQ